MQVVSSSLLLWLATSPAVSSYWLWHMWHLALDTRCCPHYIQLTAALQPYFAAPIHGARVTSNQWKQCRSRFSQSATIDIFLRVCGAKPWKSKKVELRPGPIFVYCIDLYVVVVSLGFVGAVHQGPIAFSQLME